MALDIVMRLCCALCCLLPGADEGSHWRQRMEAERLIAAQAQLELGLSQQALAVSALALGCAGLAAWALGLCRH